MPDIARLFDFESETGQPIKSSEVDAELDQLVAAVNDLKNQLLPVGAILPSGAASAPTRFLLCDGAEVSRSTYADLFAVLGIAYGAGNGTTTFNVPDLRGRSPVGKGTHVDVDSLSDSDGLAVGSRRPKHAHTVASHTHPIPHVHSATTGANSSALSIAGGGPANPVSVAGNPHTHAVTTGGPSIDPSGPAAPATDAQGPGYGVVNFMIRAVA